MNPNGNHKSKTCNRYTKPKRKECKHTTKENNQTTKKEKRKKSYKVEGQTGITNSFAVEYRNRIIKILTMVLRTANI